MKYPKKVEDLKNSYTVECKPLLSKKWTDDEIDAQITTVMEQEFFTEDELIKNMENIVIKSSHDLDIKERVEWIKKEIYKLIGWDKLTPLKDKFWENFSSAPYFIDKNDSNKPLLKLKKDKGAKGMDEIFGNRFEECYGISDVNYFIESLTERFQLEEKLKNENKKIYSSPYNNVEEIIDTLPIKKATEAGRIFWMDKTKPLKERIKAFEEYGEKESCIYEPENRFLSKIFNIYLEQGYLQRHENVSCINIVKFWIEKLKSGRTFIDYSKNSYHPSIKNEKRNYKPSKEAVDRLSNYYLEALFVGGVSEFELDW